MARWRVCLTLLGQSSMHLLGCACRTHFRSKLVHCRGGFPEAAKAIGKLANANGTKLLPVELGKKLFESREQINAPVKHGDRPNI